MDSQEETIQINGLDVGLSKLTIKQGDVLLFHTPLLPKPAAIEYLRQRCVELLGFEPLILFVPPGGAIDNLDAERSALLIQMLQQNNLLRPQGMDPVTA